MEQNFPGLMELRGQCFRGSAVISHHAFHTPGPLPTPLTDTLVQLQAEGNAGLASFQLYSPRNHNTRGECSIF